MSSARLRWDIRKENGSPVAVEMVSHDPLRLHSTASSWVIHCDSFPSSAPCDLTGVLRPSSLPPSLSIALSGGLIPCIFHTWSTLQQHCSAKGHRNGAALVGCLTLIHAQHTYTKPPRTRVEIGGNRNKHALSVISPTNRSVYTVSAHHTSAFILSRK